MSLRDIDTFTQHFIQKCVQVIVQSRLGTERTQTKCNPKAKDWFNLDITDLKDVLEQTTKCLKQISGSTQNLHFIKKDWKICCEISLKNSDGIPLVLEYWIFTNTPLTQDISDSKLSHKVYHTFIRMSNMIKSLIVLTRSTPAYRLSSKGQSADSYVICYRVYHCDDNFLLMDAIDQSPHYSSAKTLGTINCHCNELSISLVYRTDMNINTESEIRNFAKLNDNFSESSELLLPIKDDHFKQDDPIDLADVHEIFKPLNPAFAAKEDTCNELNDVLNTPFSSLLAPKETSLSEISVKESETRSKPITIPQAVSSKPVSRSPQVYSTSNESFVFVELNAPFASDDREFGSFFHGPSPTFLNSTEDVSSDINELSTQLAELESNAPQIDSFVASICIAESEELKFEA